ncbi:MAG: glutamate cyclase domain-containing protein, partial [Candidatus Hodarchaeota archaeon]
MEITRDLLNIAETLDRIMTTDVAGRGSISLMYDAARKKTGEPLALTAAKALADKVKRGDFVFILTGFLVRTQFTAEAAETDGPPGAAILARA